MKRNIFKLNRKFLLLAVVGILIVASVILLAFEKSAVRLPILMYHNIVLDGEETNSMAISKSKFERDIKYLSESGYGFVLPKDLVSPMFQLPEKPVMITFDDGYRSNYEIAFPIIRAYGAKAEISVITKMIDENREMFCTWGQLCEMKESGAIEIGSHTHNLHNPNSNGTYVQGESNGVKKKRGESKADYKQRVLDDINLSFNRITEKLGEEPCCFAYPYGVYDRTADKTVQSLFKLTLGTKPGIAKIHKKLFKLNRYEIYEDTELRNIL